MPQIITLSSDMPEIQYLCKKDKRLAKLISVIGPITYTPYDKDPYSFMVHEIIEQMLSVKAGQRIYLRLKEICGGCVCPLRISNLTDDEIKSTGTSNAKVSYIRNITDYAERGLLDIERMQQLSDKDIIRELTDIRGIGTWTAKMYLMFVLNRPNILPYEDGAFLQVYRWLYKTDICDRDSVIHRCKKWRPYASIASRFFYRALDCGLTKDEFHLFK